MKSSTPKVEPAGSDASAFSITTFCRLHGISRTLFYQLDKAGKAPAKMTLGRRVLISSESAAAWRRQMSK